MARLYSTLLTGACLCAGVFGEIIKRQQGSLPPVTSEGNAFWAGGERFYIRGVAYQPGGAADAADPLLDMSSLTRDIQRVSVVLTMWNCPRTDILQTSSSNSASTPSESTPSTTANPTTKPCKCSTMQASTSPSTPTPPNSA